MISLLKLIFTGLVYSMCKKMYLIKKKQYENKNSNVYSEGTWTELNTKRVERRYIGRSAGYSSRRRGQLRTETKEVAVDAGSETTARERGPIHRAERRHVIISRYLVYRGKTKFSWLWLSVFSVNEGGDENSLDTGQCEHHSHPWPSLAIEPCAPKRLSVKVSRKLLILPFGNIGLLTLSCLLERSCSVIFS